MTLVTKCSYFHFLCKTVAVRPQNVKNIFFIFTNSVPYLEKKKSFFLIVVYILG